MAEIHLTRLETLIGSLAYVKLVIALILLGGLEIH